MNIRNRAIAFGAIVLCLLMTFCSCAESLPAPQIMLQQDYTKKVADFREAAFITIDINPSIELTVDQNHTVTSVCAANADAEIMLWEENGIVGQNLNTALTRITELALEMGYIADDKADISVTVTTESGKTEDALLSEINEILVTSMKEADVEVNVEEAVDLVLTKELERVKKENEGKPGYDETLTVARYHLVLAALRADRELTMDNAVKLTNKKLTEIVKTTQKDAEAKLGEIYVQASAEAHFIYDNAKQTLLDSAYTTIYASRRSLASLFANYGAAYAGYRLAYRTIEHYAESLKQAIENPVFTSDDVFALANALGIDTTAEEAYDAFRQEITDENGKVTKESVNAYINRQYKSLPDDEREKLEHAYDKVMEIMDEAGAELSVITDEGKLLIQTAMFGLGLSVSVETYEDIPTLLAAIQKKIDDVSAKMDEDMTENEKARVVELQEEMNAKIAEYEETYRESIAQAQAEAEEHMSSAKEAYKKRVQGGADQ